MDTSATWDSALLELERMALAASSSDALESDSFPTDVQIARWQKLFGYTRREVFDLIKAQRADLTRTRISDEHWELVREEQEGRGGDRETYEYVLQLGNVLKGQSATIPGPDGKLAYLFRLGGVLGSKEKVMDIAGLSQEPRVVEGQGEKGRATFCVVDEETKGKIEKYLAQMQLSGAREKKCEPEKE